MDNPHANAEKQTANQIEYKIHVQSVKNIRTNFPGLRFFHIPNRPGNGADGFFKKEMGARAGASDLLVSWNLRIFPYAAFEGGVLEVGVIELKAPGKGLEAAQNKFFSSFDCIGWKTAMATSYREVHAALKRFGLKPEHEIMTEPDIRSDQQKKFDAFEMYRP